MEKELYILDTDTGVDDAMALLMLVAAKKAGKAEVLCITSVNGNCSEEYAVRNICRTLDTVGEHDIPLYRGAKEALVTPYENNCGYHGKDGFNDVVFESEPDFSRVKEGYAWEILNEMSKTYPNKINLVAVGPLTNVALAMKLDPDFSSRLKTLFIMGGNIEAYGNTSEAAEFNFHADPEGASVVLRQTRCPTYIASWELCFKYTNLTVQWRTQTLAPMKTPAAELINKLEKVWFDDWVWGNHWILCDQLAMVAALYPEAIVKKSSHHAQVELSGAVTRGMMVLDQRPVRAKPNNVFIIEHLDEVILKKSLFGAFNQ
jgi:purine nucleosidase